MTLVELPGTERLSVDRSRLHVSEEAFVHRSITHFSELVALAQRDKPEPRPVARRQAHDAPRRSDSA